MSLWLWWCSAVWWWGEPAGCGAALSSCTLVPRLHAQRLPCGVSGPCNALPSAHAQLRYSWTNERPVTLHWRPCACVCVCRNVRDLQFVTKVKQPIGPSTVSLAGWVARGGGGWPRLQHSWAAARALCAHPFQTICVLRTDTPAAQRSHLLRACHATPPLPATPPPVPQTLCNQTQRYQLYSGSYLVFETSQVQMDIPYGDHFTVETRWDITPAGEGASHVTVHLAVPFSKVGAFFLFSISFSKVGAGFTPAGACPGPEVHRCGADHCGWLAGWLAGWLLPSVRSECGWRGGVSPTRGEASATPAPAACCPCPPALLLPPISA